jgi:glycosyltransferase involved in cell wall biosynthesis
MRYLSIVDNYFLDRPEGAPRVAWGVAAAMRERGHDVSLLCRRTPGWAGPQIEWVDGVRLLRLAPAEIPSPARLVAGQFELRQDDPIVRLLRDEKWDVIHVHTPILGLQVVSAAEHRIPCVCTVHSPVEMEQAIHWRNGGISGLLRRKIGLPALHRIEAQLLARADAVHVLSNYTRDCLNQLHQLPRQPTVIPYWARPVADASGVSRQDARRRLNWPIDRPLVLTVRGHKSRCGLDIAIKALAPLAQQRRCAFVIGGDGPLRPSLESLARQLGAAEDQIIFPGRLTEEQLALAYQAADLYVLPSIELECFGLTILEAWASGCPVIGSSIGAIPELLEPITPKALVPAGNVEALRSTVASQLSGELCVATGDDLRAYVEQRFSKSYLVSCIETLMKSAAAVRKNPLQAVPSLTAACS